MPDVVFVAADPARAKAVFADPTHSVVQIPLGIGQVVVFIHGRSMVWPCCFIGVANWPELLCCIDLPAGNFGIVPAFVLGVVPNVPHGIDLRVLQVMVFEQFLCGQIQFLGAVGCFWDDGHGRFERFAHQCDKQVITSKVS